MSNAAKDRSIYAPSNSVPVETTRRIKGAYWDWLAQADIYRERGYVNEPLFATIVSLMEWQQEYDRRYRYEYFKRLMDILAAFVLIALLSPLLAFCALCIKLWDGGPVFYRHYRCGKDLKPFLMWKFRSFRYTKARRLKSKPPLAKVTNRKWQTPFGRWLRNWRIDEIPQLFNIMTGEMSLIGPRPLVLEESVTIPHRYLIRFTVKPGCLGQWQANRPNTVDGKTKLRLDCYYVRHRGFRRDFEIFLRSIPVALLGERGFDREFRSRRKKINQRPPRP